MDGLENMIYMIDQLLDTKRKRHITCLLYTSLFVLIADCVIHIDSFQCQD